jgi:glycosyltransferase involved in cell wall biosynthesis
VKRIILAVTNDLHTDQRMHRVAQSLGKLGATVTLVGRLLPYSTPLTARSYKTFRLKLLFKKGFLFYANYNLRLFFYLLFSKADIIVSNDLDTLAACFTAAKIKGTTIVYDSHEYFTEVPELLNRKFVLSIWLLIEKLFLPHIKFSYTVNESLAHIYAQKYKISMEVVRNLPLKSYNNNVSKALNFPGKKIILYQGSLNIGRGLDMAIDAMQYIESAVLVIIGEGDISNQLRQRSLDLNLNAKVTFTGRIPLDQLYPYTCSAYLGLSLEENAGLNYY